jgi:hypothetical protein
VVTDDVAKLIAVLEDADVILSTPPSGLLWAIAAWSIVEAPTAINDAGVRPEALEVVLSLCDEVRRKQNLVELALQNESKVNGCIQLCAMRVAALTAVAPVVGSPERWMKNLDEPARNIVMELRKRVAVNRLQQLCAYECEKLLAIAMPTLRTAPELSTLNERCHKMHNRVFNDLPKGSFEELTLGAMLTDVTRDIHAVAEEIAATSGTISITFPQKSVEYPQILRRNLWAKCDIDWVRTFIDISGAPCWQFSERVNEILTVPWYVMAALSWKCEAEPIPATTQRREVRRIGLDPSFGVVPLQ